MSVARRRFRFIKEIAEGGFGKVYLAEQISADGFSRIVAIKLLHAKWSSHDEIVMRTRDEARLLGLIRHQNIVRVEDLTSIDGKCAIVMEYLEGVDLKTIYGFLRERDIEFPRAALFEIMSIVASALDAAYNGRPLQGGDPLRVIHRDIKPSNIFVTVAGTVKVLDFGTARANFAEREAKTQALAFGSQGYMAPERVLGEEDTPAADVFSLGITLYELLCLESFGRIPPRPAKFAAKIEEYVSAIPLEGDAEWQEQIREVLRLMLSYDPKERPTAAQLVDIFDLLASHADDMPLRRFCRTIVTEAKAAMPEEDSGDPLTGRTVDEDVSSAFGVGQGGVDTSTPPPVSRATPPPPPPPPPMGTHSLKPTTLSTEVSTGGPASLPPSGRASTAAGAGPAHTEEPAPSGGLMKVAVAGGAALLVAVAVILVVGVVALVVWKPWGTTVATPDPIPAPAPAPADAPVPCIVTSADGRTDAETVPTTLAVSGPATEVTVSGGVGFRATWDGRGTCQLEGLVPGTYRTNVTTADGSRIRSKSFEVTGGGACSFTFDLTAREWTGGCE